MGRSFVVAATVAAAALALAACSSSATSNKPSGSSSVSGSTSESGGGGAAAQGIAAAKAYEQPFLQAPTSIGISTPLSAKPASGKSLIGLTNGTGSGKALFDYWQQASGDLGWNYKSLVYGSDPSDEQKTVESSISEHPSGVLTSGIPNSTISQQITEATAQKIWLNSSADTSPPSGAMFDTSIANPAQLAEWGKMVAAYVVVQSNGKADVADFSLPVFPILEDFDKAFQAAIKQWCPDCSVKEYPQQGTDIGTKTPQAVVSAVQANPNYNWLIFDLGDLDTGVDAALKAAGITGKHIGGLTADTPNLQALKNKTEDVWTGYSLPVVAYRQVDSMARKFLGDPILNSPLPTELITQDNVNSLVVDKAGNYVGVSDYRSEFKKLWKLTG